MRPYLADAHAHPHTGLLLKSMHAHMHKGKKIIKVLKKLRGAAQRNKMRLREERRMDGGLES